MPLLLQKTTGSIKNPASSACDLGSSEHPLLCRGGSVNVSSIITSLMGFGGQSFTKRVHEFPRNQKVVDTFCGAVSILAGAFFSERHSGSGNPKEQSCPVFDTFDTRRPRLAAPLLAN